MDALLARPCQEVDQLQVVPEVEATVLVTMVKMQVTELLTQVVAVVVTDHQAELVEHLEQVVQVLLS